jgi:hypothetical protein
VVARGSRDCQAWDESGNYSKQNEQGAIMKSQSHPVRQFTAIDTAITFFEIGTWRLWRSATCVIGHTLPRTPALQSRTISPQNRGPSARRATLVLQQRSYTHTVYTMSFKAKDLHFGELFFTLLENH